MIKRIILCFVLLSTSIFNNVAIADNSIKLMEYERSARKGDPEAQFKLGLINEFGKSTDVDMTSAMHWYNKSADQGHQRALTRLGVIFFEEENYEKSIKYIEAAMKKKEPLAFVYYGKNLLRLGDYKEAEKYFKIGIEYKNSIAYYEYGLMEGDLKGNKYLGYINTKKSEIMGNKNAANKSREYKSHLSVNQLYSANDRLKRMN